MKGYLEWDGVGLPPVGSVVVLQNVDMVDYKEFDVGCHCTVDLWANGDPLEVIAHRTIGVAMMAVVFNLHRREASAVQSAYYRPESPEDRL